MTSTNVTSQISPLGHRNLMLATLQNISFIIFFSWMTPTIRICPAVVSLLLYYLSKICHLYLVEVLEDAETKFEKLFFLQIFFMSSSISSQTLVSDKSSPPSQQVQFGKISNMLVTKREAVNQGDRCMASVVDLFPTTVCVTNGQTDNSMWPCGKQANTQDRYLRCPYLGWLHRQFELF